MTLMSMLVQAFLLGLKRRAEKDFTAPVVSMHIVFVRADGTSTETALWSAAKPASIDPEEPEP